MDQLDKGKNSVPTPDRHSHGETKSSVNWKALSQRHKRVFLRSVFFSRYFFRFLLDFKAFMRSLSRGRRKNVLLEAPVRVRDPFKKFIRQTVTISAALLVVTSIAPHGILETGFTADYVSDTDTDFIEESDELPPAPFLMNDEGFVLKPSPASEEANRIGFTDSVRHTVVSGDTLSSIAVLYGIHVKTLLWENNIAETAPLRVGQVLTIPSVDGVGHTVASASETLSGIAKQYGVAAELIKEHNKLETDTIQKGQKLFIPGGKKKEPVFVARSGQRGAGRGQVFTGSTFDQKVVIATEDSPNAGKELIFPTDGKLTQGFKRGHYALDIGNQSKPDVWAATGGTVVTAKGGCPPREVAVDRRCGSGYGNHVVIDHGDGLQTLYAHLETIYVSEGQALERGQAIGKMGSSGRTYGATGIHLHFEVYDNGVKKNPWNYF